MGDAPATRIRFRVVGAACTLAIVAYVHRVGFALALPDMGITDQRHKSWISAAFLFGYGLFEVPFGVFCDRLGPRHLLAVLVVGWSAVTALFAATGLLPDWWLVPVLVGLRFLFGLLQAGAFPSLSRVLTDWVTRRERASAQGFIWMASRGGGVVSGPLFLGLSWLLGGWQGALVGLAALGVVWAALFWPWFRNRPEEMAAVNAAELAAIAEGRAVAHGHGNVPWGRLLSSRSVWGLCLMYGFVGFASNFIVTLLPDYLQSYLHLSRDNAKWMTSVTFACGMAACVAGGFLSDAIARWTGSRRWSRRVNGLVFLTLGAAGWLAVGAARDPVALTAALCFVYFCNDMNMGPAWAACGDVGERYAGTVGGAMNMIGNFMGAGGNLVAGLLQERGQAEWMFALFAVSWVWAGLSWLLVDVTRPLPQDG